MKILFVGDVVGSIGIKMLEETLPGLKRKYRPQVTIVNGENAAGGRGITEKMYKGILQLGVDLITMGNHTWDNRDIYEFIDDEQAKIIRPENFPEGTPGIGYKIVKVNQSRLAIINIQGRVFLNALDDPFRTMDRLLATLSKETSNIFVDFHAEATSEKQAMGWYLDGKVSAMVGTHTHVQTNDARILPQGTAYLTDAGMTGAYDSILGVERSIIIQKFLTQLPVRHEVPEEGRKILSGCFIEIDDKTGKAKRIENIVVNDERPLRE
ncbi:TIGR00282 family metallophosphoesterase [Jeotgalibaca sp. MA1X17-3]|uniref:TIGR00282 family metallophosphoesterase n=1 Tax=Jeotgalibaca sp. MA1X17-3 TaxID=2908211 RepID=UPI001F19457C|nr:TIGR00282 family metallophosphoesterase [Jeotgalibaca sp. MA1X17-3]UJF14868.1 TIGR00282 family metallophosphoesterase [Jeotgalibaca sp. MA1X17-3]